MFTTLGNVIYRPIHELADIRWKDIGEHLSQTITNFEIQRRNPFAWKSISLMMRQPTLLQLVSGQIKRVERKEFSPWRTIQV